MTDTKRYQVFVSSTSKDLQKERLEVIQTLLEMNCMPAAMEFFPASNDTQWDVIERVIDLSDYYILIVGGRYGSVSEKTGLSYTEMEYRHALKKEKPVIAFMHKDPESLPARCTEKDEDKKKKLDSFRELVKTKLCKFYSNPSDLAKNVSTGMIDLIKNYPAVGWARSDCLSNELTKEMSENSDQQKRFLGEQLRKEQSECNKTIDSLNQEIEKYKFYADTMNITQYTNSFHLTYNQDEDYFKATFCDFGCYYKINYHPKTYTVMFELKIQRNPKQNGLAGFIIRGQHDEPAFMLQFGIKSSGLSVIRPHCRNQETNMSFTLIKEVELREQLNVEWNKIKIVVFGSGFKVFINDFHTHVYEETNLLHNYKQGTIGFRCYKKECGFFRNIRFSRGKHVVG